MTTVVINNTSVHIQRQGSVYVAALGTTTILTDEPAELVEKCAEIVAQQTDNIFPKTSATWTFVASEFASQYNLAKELRASASVTIPGGVHMASSHAALIRHHMISGIPTETNDALDWVEQNAKGRVEAWTLPGTDRHFYLFEDAQEAMLFKLAVTV